ncbi:putative heat shock protein [Burkholderia lata]|nr:putative heat shock protein [Burkholderia lata]
MSNVTRYDPFSIDPVSDLFQGLFMPLRGMAMTDQPDLASMKIDVTESDDAYKVNAELPGVAKDDIEVQVTGSTVSINAKIERNNEQKDGERVIRRERYSGAISRSFSLSGEIDDAKATATYQDGVLSLTLPKKAAVGQKKLTISRSGGRWRAMRTHVARRKILARGAIRAPFRRGGRRAASG